MIAWYKRLICRFRGHETHGCVTSGGLPGSPWFTISGTCRRCGEDRSITIPSGFTIYAKDREHGGDAP